MFILNLLRWSHTLGHFSESFHLKKQTFVFSLFIRPLFLHWTLQMVGYFLQGLHLEVGIWAFFFDLFMPTLERTFYDDFSETNGPLWAPLMYNVEACLSTVMSSPWHLVTRWLWKHLPLSTWNNFHYQFPQTISHFHCQLGTKLSSSYIKNAIPPESVCHKFL